GVQNGSVLSAHHKSVCGTSPLRDNPILCRRRSGPAAGLRTVDKARRHEDEYYDLYPLSVKLGFDPATLKEARRFSIGWEIKTPKALPKCCGLKLTVEATAPRVGTSYLT